jgi:hypothetical protein
MSGVFVTRDNYECDLPYSLWTTRPKKDRAGHWIRAIPTAKNARSLLTAEVGRQLIGRELLLGEIIFLPDPGSR